MQIKIWDRLTDRLGLVFLLGLFIRLAIMPYAHHGSVWEKTLFVSLVYNGGLNPFMTTLITHGSGFYLLYLPVYIPYLVLNYFGIYYPFMLDSLFKIPPLIGDIMVFYSLYGIGKWIFKDPKMSRALAAAYFLNPLVIYSSSILGGVENIMIGFLTLAILYFIKDKMVSSGICLSIASFIRYFPFLLIPFFLASVWRIRKSSFLRFIVAVLVSSLALSIPMVVNVPIYRYLSTVMGGRVTGKTITFISSILTSEQFETNLLPFLIELDIYHHPLTMLYGTNSIIILYIFVTIATLYALRKVNPTTTDALPSVTRLLNLNVIAVFAIVLGFSTAGLAFPFVIILLPFLFLESTLFRGIPSYCTHIIWFLALFDHAVVKPHYLEQFDLTFPIPRPGGWQPSFFGLFPMISFHLVFSLSLLAFLFFIHVIIMCILLSRNLEISDQTYSRDGRADIESGSLVFIFLFVVYSLLNILRFAYNMNSTFVLVFLTAFGVYILAFFTHLLHRSASLIHAGGPLFPSLTSKLIASLFVISVAIISLIIMTHGVDIPTFLLIQILIVGVIWSINRKLTVGLAIQRTSLAFIIVYIALVLLATRDVLIGLMFLLATASMAYVQLRTDLPTVA